MAQLQAGLVVSGRKWIDFISYCGGHPLYVKRVYPEQRWEQAILSAAFMFEQAAAEMIDRYHATTKTMPPTERIDLYQEVELQL